MSRNFSRASRYYDAAADASIVVVTELWRGVERCDVIVQIVDARDPLLYVPQPHPAVFFVTI